MHALYLNRCLRENLPSLALKPNGRRELLSERRQLLQVHNRHASEAVTDTPSMSPGRSFQRLIQASPVSKTCHTVGSRVLINRDTCHRWLQEVLQSCFLAWARESVLCQAFLPRLHMQNTPRYWRGHQRLLIQTRKRLNPPKS